MTTLKQIVEAWIIAFNPTESQKKQAIERYKICEECPSKKTVIIPICSECGCPISKKIFTNDYNPCPLEKWGDTDKPFMKTTKTLL